MLDFAAGDHFHAHGFEAPGGAGGERGGEGGQDARPGLDEHDAGAAGIDTAEVALHGEASEFCDGAGHLDAGGPAADEHESEQGLARGLIVFALGGFVGGQNAVADFGGVGHGLQSGGEAREAVLAEVGVLHAGGEDEEVVTDALLASAAAAAAGGFEHDLAPCGVHMRHGGEQDGGAPMCFEHLADGGGDLARHERGGGHLIEQRLEEVVVGFVDQRHAHRQALERAGGREPTEAAADHDDVWQFCIP